MKIAIVKSTGAFPENLQHLLEAELEDDQVCMFEGGADLLLQVAERENPDMLIGINVCHGPEDFAKLERLNINRPNLALILLCENVTPELLHMSMRIGISDVLTTTVSPRDLLQTIKGIEHKLALRKEPQQKGSVLGFVSAKGGSGATFMVTNLGYILAKEFDKKVALIDLHHQFGDALLFISDQTAANTLPDVIADMGRLDASLLSSAMVNVLPNFGVLAASDKPERSTEIKPAQIEALLNLARNEYDFTLLDLGRHFDANSIKALDFVDFVFPVMEETLPHIRDMHQMLLTLYALGYERKKIRVIVNRYVGNASIQLKDIERALEIKVYKACPNNFVAVSSSVNQGVPILNIAPKSNVTRFLKDFAEELVNPGGHHEGWFSSLFSQHS